MRTPADRKETTQKKERNNCSLLRIEWTMKFDKCEKLGRLSMRQNIVNHVAFGHHLLDHLLIELTEYINRLPPGHCAERFDKFCVPFFPLCLAWRISCSKFVFEKLFKRALQIDFSSPAKVQTKRDGNRVPVIDSSKEIRILRVFNHSAKYAGKTVACQHHSLTGRASRHHKIEGFAGKKQTDQKRDLDV